ncbi:D-(-)-3-hydroxybutyrate oligomer hydrolase [Marinobacter salinisoli]|uniref:D-(-)-3-hydroxybutyrate oligomer hydrolase n=1 Tax=Marinobacter salinisoli TaxID=2769486 RepID=A0ABX7MTL8_9GAMM|nr:3-hydroxybutyrate oligomer hydrolase family protein [Marinobacter salinisoli]QSP95634.1 D-(-)-3-hydroxybutyrate oligomer hydrolase [Marinobacter salinisoli]
MKRTVLCALIGASAVALTACNDNNGKKPINFVPDFVQGDIQQTSYDGVTDDLLTAGLGASGLAGAAPAFDDPLNPTPAELRKLAIYNNYRALVDTSAAGGYGTFFGPQVGADGEGLIAGDEFIAYMSVPGTDVPVTVMAQVPDSFNAEQPCMVTAPSSGSRGIYGAIGTAGEWGLKKGCAVVYTDKGTGTGSHNLETNAAQRIDGTLTDGDEAVQFRADLTDEQRADFNSQSPDRFAWKHAHSKANPEADWGRHVLQSIEFGFYVLNEKFGRELGTEAVLRTITPDNTLVIASSISNGGGASVRAAEQDTDGLIDGVAVSEPNVNPVVDRSFTIVQGDGPVISEHSRSLLDYTTALAVYQGCANQASVNAAAPYNFNNAEIGANICAALAEKNLLDVEPGATLEEQAADALRILNDVYGIQPEQNPLAPIHFLINVPQSISVTYANAYARAGVEDRVCNLSFAATLPLLDTISNPGALTQLTAEGEAALFATSNGIPPTGGVNIVYDDAEGQPTNLAGSTSPGAAGKDYGLEALLCLRSLAQGTDAETGAALEGEQAELAAAIAEGIEAVRASGDLQGKPTVFVTGRADAILPINHTSRPYFGLNQKVEGDNSNLRYYEVLNAHHLDVLNGLRFPLAIPGIGGDLVPGLVDTYVPLHHYYFQALDLVWANLTEGEALPPSQVVRTTPRGDVATPLSSDNLPDIAAEPVPADLIVFEDNQVRIPD